MKAWLTLGHSMTAVSDREEHVKGSREVKCLTFPHGGLEAELTYSFNRNGKLWVESTYYYYLLH